MNISKKKLVWLTSLLVLAPAGCTHTEKTPTAAAAPKDAHAPKTTITSGSCLELKDSPADKGLADEFELRVGELLKQNKTFSASQMVVRYPDRANTIVRSSSRHSNAALFIRQVHQGQLAGTDIYTAVPNLLALGEKHRLNKEESAWIASWEKAVLLAAAAPVPDPNLWEKISSLQPATHPWPEALAGNFQSYWKRRGQSHVAATPVSVQDLVWFSIGHWHMDRGEAKAAFAAFKRANVQSPQVWQDMVEIYQAKALMQLKQSPAAITMLARLATKNDSPWKRTALATMGACKFQDGHFQQAETLYKKALDKLSPGEDFAGKNEAESDLGLTLLALGHEAKGLAQLRASRENFARSGRIEDVLEDLDNEIRYFEKTNRPTLVQSLRQDYDQWQQRSSF